MVLGDHGAIWTALDPLSAALDPLLAALYLPLALLEPAGVKSKWVQDFVG